MIIFQFCSLFFSSNTTYWNLECTGSATLSRHSSIYSRRSSVTLAIAVWYFHLSTEQRAVRQWRPGWQIESKTSTANPFLCAAEISYNTYKQLGSCWVAVG